jgi:hypothetical protein
MSALTAHFHSKVLIASAAMRACLLLVGCACALFCPPGFAQVQPSSLSIHGVVKSSTTPLPGATVTATHKQSGHKATTATDLDGSYSLALSEDGDYLLEVQMAGFALAEKTVAVNAAAVPLAADFDLTLLSRVQKPSTVTATPTERRAAFGQGGQRFQNLSVLQAANNGDSSTDSVTLPGMPVPGIDPNSATESVAVSGTTENPSFAGMSGDEMQQRMQEFRDQQGAGRGGPGGGPGGGGFGGPGGPGGGPGIFLGGFGGRGRFDINRPHGSVYYNVGDAGLDATPYSLSGLPVTKPGYLQNRFGVAFGGPLDIPKIFHGGNKTFFFFNYNGTRNENPYDAFSTVPTLEERAGNFANTVYTSGPNQGLPVQLAGPGTANGNTVTQIDPAALALLSYIPLPTPGLEGQAQNLRYITSISNHSNDINLRINHTLGAAQAGPPRGRRGPRNNLNFGLHYHTADNILTNPFSTLGGTTSVRSFDIPVGYVRSFGKLINNLRFDFNRNRVSTQNLYAFKTNVAGNAGITGISQNPFDWGVPNLAFTDYTGLQDTNPVLRRDQTITLSDSMILNRGKHTWRWGGDFRFLQTNPQTNSNPRGTFTFGNAFSGYDFANFLLGLPQQTSVQYTPNGFHFRGHSWDLFVQDEWRVRGNLTLNLGVRYEYVSPYTELNNRIVNLDVASGFTAVAPVQPGQTGPYTGSFPASLINPDRNNFAPRLGIAWKIRSKSVLRGGYGVNYNTGAYSSMIQQLAFQPPFSFTQTNTQAGLTLENGFPTSTASVTNNYAVDRNYRLGYVQIWNVDLQQEIRSSLILNLDYTGTKGTRLDIVEAPNRGATGTLLNGVQPFLWETAAGDSTANAGTVRLRKRLQRGVSLGGSYTWSKSIDNASSIGGGGTVVAQDAADLAAERSLSSFDQRHRFTGDYLWELPFGHDRRWLSKSGLARAALGDWQWGGSWTISTGTPFTPRILGNAADLSRGTNGTLRAELTGQPISISNPSIAEWFNTAAFTTPLTNQFGDARRNSIEGPPTVVFTMSATKMFPLGNSRALEFRAQASNVFNHPNYSSIDTVLDSRTYGRVTSVSSMRTIQINARFRF